MFQSSSVKEIVRNDYRTAQVFQKFGINYCCAGNLDLDQVCKVQNIAIDNLVDALSFATKNIMLPTTVNFTHWPSDFLVDYLINVHHNYLRTALPHLRNTLQAFVPGHKNKFPYMEKVQVTFYELEGELLSQMNKEEKLLFPYIKKVINTLNATEENSSLFIRLIKNPVNYVEDELQQQILTLLENLRNDTDNYTHNGKACTRHQVIYSQLKELEADLIQHYYLEQTILFPKVAQMEKELMAL